MKHLSLEKTIYLCKYHEVDCLNLKRSEVEEIINDLKSKGLYEYYRNLDEYEYERMINSRKYQIRKVKNMEKEEENNNTLLNLNDILFKQLERLTNDELTQDQLDMEIKTSKQVVSVSQTIINNASLLLNAKKHFDSTQNKNKKISKLLSLGEENEK